MVCACKRTLSYVHNLDEEKKWSPVLNDQVEQWEDESDSEEQINWERVRKHLKLWHKCTNAKSK